MNSSGCWCNIEIPSPMRNEEAREREMNKTTNISFTSMDVGMEIEFT